MQGNWPRLSGFLSPAKRKDSPRGRTKVADEKSAGDFMENEVDPILDKISAHGIQSLTARERQILEAARKRVRRP
jgi:hypothetical protein